MRVSASPPAASAALFAYALGYFAVFVLLGAWSGWVMRPWRLLGLQVPPNYGPQYAAEFSAMYAEVAKRHKTALVPFFLKGVADIDKADALFQSDRIHPVEAAHPIMLGNVWPALRKLLP